MKSITMTAEQTIRYDADDVALIRELRAEAEDLHRQTGETVEVYTADGIVAIVAQD